MSKVNPRCRTENTPSGNTGRGVAGLCWGLGGRESWFVSNVPLSTIPWGTGFGDDLQEYLGLLSFLLVLSNIRTVWQHNTEPGSKGTKIVASEPGFII